MLTNNVTLANNGHDTLRPLGICLGPWEIVHMTMTTINGGVHEN
jgi:hypothetical protein